MIRVIVLGACLSLFLAYLVAPLAEALRRRVRVGRRRRPLARTWAILVVYAGGIAAIAGSWTVMAPRSQNQMEQIAASLPVHAERALAIARSAASPLQHTPGTRSLHATLGATARWATGFFERHARRTLDEVLDGLPHLRWLWFAPVAAFLLIELFPTFRRSTLRVLPTDHVRWRADEFLRHVNSLLAGYVRAQLIAAGFVGVTTAALLALLKVPYALTFGLAAAVLELLPVIGPVTVAIAVLLLVPGTQVLAALGVLAVVRVAQDAYVYPRVVGRRTHLPPLAVLFALLVGARLGGIVGVAVAVPVVGVLSLAWRHWRDHRAIVELVREHALMQARAAAARPPAGLAKDHDGGTTGHGVGPVDGAAAAAQNDVVSVTEAATPGA